MSMRASLSHLNVGAGRSLSLAAGARRGLACLVSVLVIFGCVSYGNLWREQRTAENCVEQGSVYDYEIGRCRDDLERGRGLPLSDRAPWLSSSARWALGLGAVLAVGLLLGAAAGARGGRAS